MAEDTNATNVIRKKDATFPPDLDFETLRSEGIDYLGKLSGKIWTDYNVHDPGITILEVLCYSLLDLGYRASLPIADLLSMNPAAASKEDNFFTPARILSINPLTILDYRKLLIDIDGVRNAWLEVTHQAQQDVYRHKGDKLDCYGQDVSSEGNQGKVALNGLYNILIEPETLPTDAAQRAQALSTLKVRIRERLMAHRNLCEDFYNINILCHEQIGICTEIQLEDNADAPTVLNAMVQALYRFLSPRANFYTLQQMLTDKQLPIEEIFAGRDYTPSSHGFIDTAELEAIVPITELHVSDLYREMFRISGVKSVNTLSVAGYVNNMATPVVSTNDVKDLKGTKSKGAIWSLPLLSGHLPELSLPYCQFVFRRGSATFTFKGDAILPYVNLSALNGSKVAYKQPSLYLDTAVPSGFFRSDLGQYYSLQHDFPRVYAIGKGELGRDASPQRVVEVQQLKGFLLFFDQLLSNYLAQLQHLRNIFSFSPDVTPHTYFIGGLEDVPDLDQLLRFQQNGIYADLGWQQQDTLMLPVDKSLLNTLRVDVPVTIDIIQRWRNKYYSYDYLVARNTAMEQLLLDMVNQDNQAYVQTYLFGDACWFFVIAPANRPYVLLSSRYYPTQQKAKEAAQSAIFLAASKSNLRAFSFEDNTGHDRYAFDIVFSLSDYRGYLQQIVEDTTLYVQRREQMLNHLLARFGEVFTDYALVLYGVKDPMVAAARGIRAKAAFLSAYDSLGRNRGKAYDYRANKWRSANISGYEKRVAALAGIAGQQQHYLCPFIVGPYEAYFYGELKNAGGEVILRTSNYVTAEDAMQATMQLTRALEQPQLYVKTDDSITQQYGFSIPLAAGNAYWVPATNSAAQRDEQLQALQQQFAVSPLQGTVAVSRYQYSIEVADPAGHPFLHSHQVFPSQSAAQTAADELLANVQEQEWEWQQPGEPAPLQLLSVNAAHSQYVNLTAFKVVYTQDGEGKWVVTLSHEPDAENMLVSAIPVDSEALAADAFHMILQLAAAPANYLVRQNEQGKYEIALTERNEVKALHPAVFDEEQQAKNMALQLQQVMAAQQYTVTYTQQPVGWNYQIQLHGMQEKPFLFNGPEEYTSEAAAQAALTTAIASPAHISLQPAAKDIAPALLHAATAETLPLAANAGTATGEAMSQAISLAQLRSGELPTDALSYVRSTATTDGDYVYRVINKNSCMAFYPGKLVDKAAAEQTLTSLRSKDQQGIDYLEICMGGEDVVACMIDPITQVKRYYYVISGMKKAYVEDIYPKEETIYFRSYKTYASSEEAAAAFMQQYLQLTHLAGDPAAYGSSIVWEGDPVTADPSAQPLALVPAATINQFGGKASAQAIIPQLLRSFPYHWLENVQRFRVQLYDAKAGKRLWKLCDAYTTMGEAYDGLQLFLSLAAYAGNTRICTNEESCRYRVVMDEVLVESLHHYSNAPDAWGAEKESEKNGIYFTGLESLLDATRWGGDAYYPYKTNQYYSFKVVRKGYRLALHPYTYNTEADRDIYLSQLKQLGAKKGGHCPVNITTSVIQTDKHWEIQLMVDGQLRLSAAQSFNSIGSAQQAREDWLFQVLQWIWNDSYFLLHAGEDRFKLGDERSKFVLGYYVPDSSFTLTDAGKQQWKQLLRDAALLYPFRRIKAALGYNYLFRLYDNDFIPQEPVRDPSDPAGCNCDAPPPAQQKGAIIWESAAIYDCLAAATRDFQRFCNALKVPDNCQPSADDGCGPFGIELVDANYVEAFNPQHYASLAMAKAAIIRAGAAINDEGMHLVEHILLRPRRREQDCSCLLPVHPDMLCKLPWKEEVVGYTLPQEDITSGDPDILSTTIVPYTDPYSFVATVVLPGWPLRFRNTTTRAMMEDLLRREAPAHILLNIQWARPRTFCNFETLYRRWLQQLACKSVCNDTGNLLCCLICALFGIEAMPPLSDDAPDPDCTPLQAPCASDKITDPDFGKILNGLFSKSCGEQSLGCLGEDVPPPPPPPPGLTAPPLHVMEEPVATNPEGAAPSVEAMASAATVADRAAVEEATMQLNRRGRQRLLKYKQNILPVDADTIVDTEAYGRTEKFMEAGPLNIDKYNALADFLLGRLPDDKTKAAASEQALLLANATWLCLDQLLLRVPATLSAGEMELLQQIFRKMKEKGLDLNALASNWKPEDLATSANTDLIRQCKQWME